jgi:N-formylglutamate deformylase
MLIFSKQSYQVVKNKVFTGGYITKHYSSLSNVEALQIEIRYQVYLDDSQLDKPFIPDWNTPKFHLTKIKLQRVFKAIVNSIES